MVFGNTFLKWSNAGCLVSWVNTAYRPPLKMNIDMITKKLKEKMMNSNDPMTDVIIKANNDIGNPIITARFLISL